MQARFALFTIAAAAGLAPWALASQATHGYTPPRGFVPDSATAVAVAVAVWTPIYGAVQIASERPYRARLRAGVWTVEGSLPFRVVNGDTLRVPGGVAVAEIVRRDARILRVSHSR
jgi:hypothetical protein